MACVGRAEYVAYFCHNHKDKNWVQDTLVHHLEQKHALQCALYERDFQRIGDYVFNLWIQFFKTSQHIVVVLSPDFLKCKKAMYQLRLAVDYCVDSNVSKIIPLVYKSCDTPLELKQFKEIDTSQKFWWKTFVDRLRTAPGPVCRGDEYYINLSEVKPLVERKVISEPNNTATVLPERIYLNLKANALKQRHRMPFEDEEFAVPPFRSRNYSCPAKYAHTSAGSLGKRSSSERDSSEEGSVSKRELHEENHDPSETHSENEDTEKLRDLEGGVDPRALRAGDYACRNRTGNGSRRQEYDHGIVCCEDSLDPRILRAGDHVIKRRRGKKNRTDVNDTVSES